MFKKNLAQQPTEKNSALKKVLGEDFNSPQPKKKSCIANRAKESWDLINRYPSTTLYTIP